MSKPATLRLFVAVRIPEDRLAFVAEQTQDLREEIEGARWAPLQNQHVTLKFLGSTPAEELAAVQKAVKVSARHPSAEVSLAQLGAFPSVKRARVLWVGLDDPAGLMVGIAADLDKNLEPLGYRVEKRPFTPHLTLARLKVPARLPLLPELKPSEPFVTDRVGLWRSHLSPKGSRYEVMGEFPLR